MRFDAGKEVGGGPGDVPERGRSDASSDVALRDVSGVQGAISEVPRRWLQEAFISE